MGIYLNPGTKKFENALNSAIYVDKTGMISYLNSVVNTNDRYLAVSRPRRFGKSLTAEMICSYYEKELDSGSLFSERKISNEDNWDKYLNSYNVIRINMVDFVTRAKSIDSMISLLQSRVTNELINNFPEVNFSDSGDLSFSMEDIYNQTGEQFIIVIDEWDCIFRELDDDKAEEDYLGFLRDLFKDKDYIALAYITGILPIKKYGHHSALNMFIEYSMIAPKQLAEYTGFTDEEVKELCEKYGREYSKIREWYDGYELYGIVPEGENKANEYQIYSPYSVVQAIITGQLRDYWNSTETYEALRVHINRNFSGLKDMVMLLMEGKRLSINTRQYQNDMSSMASADDILTLLIHLGYLAYDDANGEVYIPNKEVLDEYKNTIEGDSSWDVLYAKLAQSQRLLEATWAGDENTVSEMVENAHMKAGNQTYNSEAALSYAIRLSYINAEQYYTVIPEMQAGKGYADLTYIPSNKYPDKPAMIIELKYDKSAETAIDQIHRQKYPEALEKYKGNILLVGINYDKDASNEDEGFKHHSCIIEKA